MSIPQDRIDRAYDRLKRETEAGGYNLNTDRGFVRDLIEGLLTNEDRYGYPACPCRLASGDRTDDLDIVCPCDYRDPDLLEYGACYCALYVSRAVVEGRTKVTSIPDRRPPRREEHRQFSGRSESSPVGTLPYPVWRCRVCGYLCAREGPPELCPVCKAKSDRFERFM